jgi:hypothetical protein
MEFTAVVVSAFLTGRNPVNLGVLVLDEGADRLHLRFRTDLDGIADPPDLEVIQGLPAMIESMAVEMGAVGVLQRLEEAANAIRLGDRFTIQGTDGTDAIDRAFMAHVMFVGSRRNQTV